MKSRDVIRIAGPVLGAASFVVVSAEIPGMAGYAVGFLLFLTCSVVSERWWRRRANREEIQRDLESRVRDWP